MDYPSAGEIALEVLDTAIARLGNAKEAGEQLGNRWLSRAAGEYIPILVRVRGGLERVLGLVREGRCIVARVEACSLDRLVHELRMKVHSEAPAVLRRTIVEALAAASGFLSPLCEADRLDCREGVSD